jgi:hypothetical protein
MPAEASSPSDPPVAAAPVEPIPPLGGEGAAQGPSPRRAPRRLRRAVLQAVVGLFLGLGITEAGFRARDGGAFPLVNVYAPDAERGVRLRPGASTTVGRPGERPIHVRVNADGYRGPAFPPPTPGEVLIVGDSITFGLGVEETETLAARLHEALPGRPPVLDASVPTYGPPEYRITAAAMLEKRRPSTLVVAINLINDFDELDRPNTGRHTAVDGWAVRVGYGAPPPPSALREALIQRSHAAFALWRTQWASAPLLPPEDGTTASLAAAMEIVREKHDVEVSSRNAQEQRAVVVAAREEIAAASRTIVALGSRYGAAAFDASALALDWHEDLRHDPHPERVIFELSFGGCLPSFPYRLRNHRELGWPSRADVELALLQIQAVRAMPAAEGAAVEEAFVRREAAEKRIREVSFAVHGRPGGGLLYDVDDSTGLGLGWASTGAASRRGTWLPPLPGDWRPENVLRSFIVEMRDLAVAHGARLVVLPVPLDAQIAEEARARRGLDAADVAALDGLVAAVAGSARAWGALGVDPTPRLKALGTATYLPDGHLSAVGHEILAHALADVLGEP